MTKIRCGITMGDPSGIGPEVIAKALKKAQIRALADFVVVGDLWVFRKSHQLSAISAQLDFVDLKNVSKKEFAFGKVRAEYGKAAVEYLDKALELIKDKKIDCLVTGPVNKKSINLAGFDFTGQTEYIAQAFGVKDALMMLLNKKLRVVLLTRHIPLKEVAKNLSREKIARTILNTASGLRTFLAIRNPQIAVCGLNPHASDNGVIGDEERELIMPAIKKAKLKGVKVCGPFPADTIFQKALKGQWDCLVCMYHDQGLIPLKLSGFSSAVNVTLGLPFVRTSPGHGTAFDIVRKNIADPASLIEAVKTAIQCTKNRTNAFM